MKLESGNLLTRWLLGCCTVLALVVVTQWMLPVGLESTSTMDTGDVELPVVAATDYSSPRIGEYGAILERPVFFKDRRLPLELVTRQAPPTIPLRLKLEGIALGGDSKVAVLRDLTNNKLLQLAPGMAHNGWDLSAVSTGSATFERDGQLSTLNLELAGRSR